MELSLSTTQLIYIFCFIILLTVQVAIFFLIQKTNKNHNRTIQQYSEKLIKQMEIQAAILDNVQKVAGQFRKESKHQEEVRQLLTEVHSEVINQSLSKLKLDEAIKNAITKS